MKSLKLGNLSISMKQRDLILFIYIFIFWGGCLCFVRFSQNSVQGRLVWVDSRRWFAFSLPTVPPTSFFPLKSKIDMLCVAVPPPLCFKPAWAQCRSIAATCFTSCCAAHNYRGLNHKQWIHKSIKRKKNRKYLPTWPVCGQSGECVHIHQKIGLSFSTEIFVFRPLV